MFKVFKNEPVIYGISSVFDGNMHVASAGNTENRTEFFGKEKIVGDKIFATDLVHGTKVCKVSAGDQNYIIAKADGLVTADKNVILTITVADCFPVYFFDPVKSIIGLAHCGWRGTLDNIAGNTIGTMNSNPANVIVGIGPGIQCCHFKIKRDILGKFKNYPKAISRRGNKIFVDLPAIITEQLTEAGVKKIESFGECTYCHSEKYFSFRRDKPTAVEAMVAYIGLLN